MLTSFFVFIQAIRVTERITKRSFGGFISFCCSFSYLYFHSELFGEWIKLTRWRMIEVFIWMKDIRTKSIRGTIIKRKKRLLFIARRQYQIFNESSQVRKKVAENLRQKKFYFSKQTFFFWGEGVEIDSVEVIMAGQTTPFSLPFFLL